MDYFFIPPEDQMANARWWFLLSPEQKRFYLTDSELTGSEIQKVLNFYGEGSLIKEEDNEAS